MAITLRTVKGAALTHSELDANFTDITSSMVHSGSISGTTLTLHKSGSTLDLDLSGLGGGSSTPTGSLLTTGSVSNNVLTFTKGDGSTFNLTVDTGSGGISLGDLSVVLGAASESGSLSYNNGTGVFTFNPTDLSGLGGGGTGTYTNLTPTPVDFPNADDPSIPVGSTFENKTFEEMMNMMLYPTLYPTLTAPSNTFTMSPSGFREIGETISTITLNASFNRGSINPDYGTDGFRSGEPNRYVYTGTDTSDNDSTSLTDTETISSYTVLAGAQSWTGAVSYDAGTQPLDSEGNNYDSPLSAGTTSAITRTITGVYPVFATTSAIGTLTKQSLQSMNTYIQVSMVAETGNGVKQTIDIPDAWSTITGIQQFNTISQTWQTIPNGLDEFNINTITRTIQSVSGIAYNQYVYAGATIGARQLRFTV